MGALTLTGEQLQALVKAQASINRAVKAQWEDSDYSEERVIAAIREAQGYLNEAGPIRGWEHGD
jgi:hypothetical protein